MSINFKILHRLYGSFFRKAIQHIHVVSIEFIQNHYCSGRQHIKIVRATPKKCFLLIFHALSSMKKCFANISYIRMLCASTSQNWSWEVTFKFWYLSESGYNSVGSLLWCKNISMHYHVSHDNYTTLCIQCKYINFILISLV